MGIETHCRPPLAISRPECKVLYLFSFIGRITPQGKVKLILDRKFLAHCALMLGFKEDAMNLVHGEGADVIIFESEKRML